MAVYDDWILKSQRDLDTAKALLEKPIMIPLPLSIIPNNALKKH
jgi:hypothetical protein